jgi:hypothetical protein
MRSAVSASAAGATVLSKARVSSQPTPAATPASRRHRKLNLSPRATSVRKPQGKYPGIMRALPAAGHERLRKVAREQGLAAATEFAGTLPL